MGAEVQGAEPAVPVGAVALENLRKYRLEQEREWYLSEAGFLDFVRDSGAAPLAQQKPHGEGAHSILNWKSQPDPEATDQKLYTYKMVLWPRGSFKSAVFNVGYCAWLIAQNPDIRILVCSETSKQARPFVNKTMEIVDSPWFRERFGVHRGKGWRQEGFVSSMRTNTNIKEPTLQATGVGEVRTGMHWDFVLMDDVCSQENTKSNESIEGLWNWFGETLAQLDPGCKLLVIGTLHHYSDIYCTIMGSSVMRKFFEFSVNAWADPLIDPNSDEPTELFFPGRLTRAFVARQKASMPSRLYACFYENQPQSAENQLFKPEFFHVIEDDDVPSNLWTYIFTDFAFIAEEKKKGRPDRTCFWVVGLDANRYAYVLDFIVGRWKPSVSVRIACDLWNRYQRFNLRGIAVEDTTHKELLSSLFDEIRRETFIRPKIIPIGGRSQDIKDRRIEALEPRFKRGLIYFVRSLKENMRRWKPMFAEMTQWPLTKFDDIPDALSDIDKRMAVSGMGKEGPYYCPSPPAGWRSNAMTIRQPTMIDGQYNPDHGYPAREFTKAKQQGGGNADIWRDSRSTDSGEGERASRSLDIFRRQPPPPKQLGQS